MTTGAAANPPRLNPYSRSLMSAWSSRLPLMKSPPPAFQVSVHQSASSLRVSSSRTTTNDQGWVFSALGACTALCSICSMSASCTWASGSNRLQARCARITVRSSDTSVGQPALATGRPAGHRHGGQVEGLAKRQLAGHHPLKEIRHHGVRFLIELINDQIPVRGRGKLRWQVGIVGDVELAEIVALGRDHTRNVEHLGYVHLVVPLVEGVVLTLDGIAQDDEPISRHGNAFR